MCVAHLTAFVHTADPFVYTADPMCVGAIYFTSLCLCFILPMSAVEVRILKLGLIVSPIGGHYGYSLQGPTGAQPQHYLHHTKFNYNYGAGLFPEGFWCDLVMGTRYLGKESGKRD